MQLCLPCYLPAPGGCFSGDCRLRQVPQLPEDYPARSGLQNAGRGGLLELTFYLPGHVLWALNSSLY
jgi:hypothetical protein